MADAQTADLEAAQTTTPLPQTNARTGLHQPGPETGGTRYPASGGYFQPAPYTPIRKFANPAPLGLCGFAATTFLLSLINVNTQGLTTNNGVVGLAYAYGGLIQLLAGMWEMAAGNTFGATALSSYGGFWISLAIMETPSFNVVGAYANPDDFQHALGLYLFCWFIFTVLLTLCVTRSTIAFFSLFFFLDLAFLFLGCAQVTLTNGAPNAHLAKAGGVFGLLAAIFAWYCALAGMANVENSFFTVPIGHLPWSVTYREKRAARTQLAGKKH